MKYLIQGRAASQPDKAVGHRLTDQQVQRLDRGDGGRVVEAVGKIIKFHRLDLFLI